MLTNFWQWLTGQSRDKEAEWNRRAKELDAACEALVF